MFAALNGSRLSLPLLVLIPCLTSPETKTSEATNLLNEALPTSAKPFLMSLELTCNVLPKMNRAEGKPFYVYMLAAANKFLRRYYAKLRDYFASLDTLQPVAPIPTILKATL